MLPREPEKSDSLPVPLEQYAEDKLRENFKMFVVAFAKTYKLQLHQPTPDFASIEDFLAHRYNFWNEDIEHDDPFAL